MGLTTVEENIIFGGIVLVSKGGRGMGEGEGGWGGGGGRCLFA